MGKKRIRGQVRIHPEGALRDEILRRLERVEGGAWANRIAPAENFSDDDRRRLTEYAGGIARRLRWLDFLIDHFSVRSKGVEPLVRQILRIGVYDLVELHRPAHSVVFASVEQAKRLAGGGVDKFINGVLRTVSRSIDSLPLPASGDEVVDLAVIYSHPDWMARMWVDQLGMESARLLMECNNRRPPHSIRVNTLKTSVQDFCGLLDRLDVAWNGSAYLPEFIRVEKLQPVIRARVFDSGLAAIQDESAGLVGRVLNPRPGEYIIDACAAPGGKLIHAGILMENRGRLVGIDLNAKRLAAGAATARAHGLNIVETRVGDFRTFTPAETLAAADAVLLDAPCSGLGVLARRPDLRWRRTEASIAELIALQDELLDAAAAFVKPGGRLVYATCTIVPEENERRVEAFLIRNPSFLLESVSESIHPSLERGGYLVTLPHVQQIDGAFAARMIRR